MRGPRLRNGLTPPELVDEVLGKRIERLGRSEAPQQPSSDQLSVELRKTRVLLRTAVVVAAWEGVLALIVIGLHLIGVQ